MKLHRRAIPWLLSGFFLTGFLLATAIFASRTDAQTMPMPAAASSPSAPSAAAASPSTEAAASPEPLFKGLGHLHHPVTTKSPEAQRYFDQGLTFVYAFNHDEAAGSFRRAAELDPDLAMAQWGIALALGPNINLPEDTERGKQAYAAIVKAQALAPKANAHDRAYIDALAKRYGSDGKMTLAQQRAYANAMREVWHRYPDDPDAGALFAESMMDLHPWNLWTHDGKPVEGTEEIVATLEEVIRKHPDHLGANHYYIHAVEASPHPERALKSADRLPALAPAAGHIVHMPSHIYIRVGEYHEAAEANEAAIKADREYIEQRHPSGVYVMMYYPHNIAFLLAACMMEGDRRCSMSSARELAAVATPEVAREMPMVESAVPSLLFAQARFGEWDAILKEPQPPPDLKYATAIWHYARGLAFAAKRQSSDAENEAKQLDEIAKQMPADRTVGFNSAKRLLDLASETLAGEIASLEGHREDAIRHLQEAVAIQDSLNYEEPPAWYYPVRETLGMELLAQGKVALAEQVFREDLKRNPDNGRSLFGLMLCMRAEKDDRQAADEEAKFKKAWAHADVKLMGPQPPQATAASN